MAIFTPADGKIFCTRTSRSPLLFARREFTSDFRRLVCLYKQISHLKRRTNRTTLHVQHVFLPFSVIGSSTCKQGTHPTIRPPPACIKMNSIHSHVFKCFIIKNQSPAVRRPISANPRLFKSIFSDNIFYFF